MLLTASTPHSRQALGWGLQKQPGVLLVVTRDLPRKVRESGPDAWPTGHTALSLSVSIKFYWNTAQRHAVSVALVLPPKNRMTCPAKNVYDVALYRDHLPAKCRQTSASVRLFSGGLWGPTENNGVLCYPPPHVPTPIVDAARTVGAQTENPPCVPRNQEPVPQGHAGQFTELTPDRHAALQNFNKIERVQPKHPQSAHPPFLRGFPHTLHTFHTHAHTPTCCPQTPPQPAPHVG